MAKQAKSRLGLTIDHVLIAVRDLKDTADVFNNLGFTVTPEGLHPGRGSRNRLVVFENDYLELISITDPTLPLFRPNMAVFLESHQGIFIFSMGFPQELDEDITLEKKWLMILPASQEKHGPVADKVTSIIADAATSVGRFEVIDRNLVDEILEEQAFQMSGIVSDEQVMEFLFLLQITQNDAVYQQKLHLD